MNALEFLMIVRRECESKGCLKCRLTVQACPIINIKACTDDLLDGFVLNAEEIAKEEPINKWWE